MTKRYKITILAAATVALALFTAGNSFAASVSGGCVAIDGNASFTCTYSGGTIDVPSGAQIMVTLSPGVQMMYEGNDSGSLYGLETDNLSVNPVNRNEYGFASDYSGYYVHPNETDALTVMSLTTDITAYTLFNGWVAMGGSS